MNYCNYVIVFSAIFVCPIIGDEGLGPAIENLYEKISITDGVWNPINVSMTAVNPEILKTENLKYDFIKSKNEEWNPFKNKRSTTTTTPRPENPWIAVVDIIKDNMDDWNPFRSKKLNIIVTTTLRNPWLAVIGDVTHINEAWNPFKKSGYVMPTTTTTTTTENPNHFNKADNWDPFKSEQLIITTTTTSGYPCLSAVDLVTNKYNGWNPFKTWRTSTTLGIENSWLELNNSVTNKYDGWNPFKTWRTSTTLDNPWLESNNTVTNKYDGWNPFRSKRSNTTPTIVNPWLEINNIIKNKTDGWNPFRRKRLNLTTTTENTLVHLADGQGMHQLIKIIKDPMYKRYDGLMKKRETKHGFHYTDLFTKAPSTVIHMLAPELLNGQFYKKKSYIKGTTPIYSRKHYYLNENDSISVNEPTLDVKQLEKSIKPTYISTNLPVTQRNVVGHIEYMELSDLDYFKKMKLIHDKDNDYDKKVLIATTGKPKYHFAHNYHQPEIVGSFNKYYAIKKTVVPDANAYKASGSYLQPMVKAEKIDDRVDSIFANNDKNSDKMAHDTYYILKDKMLTMPNKLPSKNKENIPPPKENKFSTNERYKKLQDNNVYPMPTAKRNVERFSFNNKFYKPNSMYDENTNKPIYKMAPVTQINYLKYIQNDDFIDSFQNLKTKNALIPQINLKGVMLNVKKGDDVKSNKLSISEKVSEQSIKELKKVEKKQQKLGLSIPLLTKPKWWQHMVSNFDKYNKDNSRYLKSE